MAESGSSGATTEMTAPDANLELMELKVKCGNYAEKCMTLMQEHQAQETAWKEREKAMIKKLEDALRAIKLLKAKAEAVESQKEIGETHADLQNKIQLASLQKKNHSLTLDIKSLESQLEMKSTLESKKSKLVELLDLKLSEKGKLVDLMKLKLSQKDAKVALCEARMAQLDKIKCEMALRLEIFRQLLKKNNIESGEPFEVEMARKRALEKLEKEKEEGQEPGNSPAANTEEQKSATPAEPQVNVTEPLVDELANVQPKETAQQPVSQPGEETTQPVDAGTGV